MPKSGAGTSTTNPQVAVLIAAWRAEDTLARAIESALSQTVPVEVIVVDDASPDQTYSIATGTAERDSRVTAVRQDQNLGPAASRNAGLAMSRAPWVTVLDADDFFCEPDRLAVLLEIANAENADFVADDLWKVSEDDPNGPRVAMISEDSIGKKHLSATEFVNGNLSSKHGGRREYGFLKPLMSRDFLMRHRLSYDPKIRLGEDYVLYTKSLIAGARFVLTDGAGYAAVVRANSLSGSHPTEAHEQLIRGDKAMLALPGVDGSLRKALKAHMLEQQKKWAWRRLIDAKGNSDLRAAVGCFWAPPAVIFDLFDKLWVEFKSRLAAG